MCGLQDAGAGPGPAPVTAEELEAIMKGGGQQSKPRRKKQKTDPAAVGAIHAQGPDVPPVSPGLQPSHAAAATDLKAGLPATQMPQDPSTAALARTAARSSWGQTAERPDSARPSISMETGHTAAAVHADPISAMPPPRTTASAGPTGQAAYQGSHSQPLGAGLSAAAPPGQGDGALPSADQQVPAGGSLQAAGQEGRALARPAESQGGSVASDSAWGTEEERMQRKLQRQADKQRAK